MKKILLTIIVMILLGFGISYYIGNQNKALNQPLIPQEDAEEIVEEELDEETLAEVTDVEEDSLPGRLSHAIQDTIDRIFQREMKIVAIGDSLTRGVGDETDGNGYVGILERSLNQDRKLAHFENFGVPGIRTDHLLNRLNQPVIEEALAEANMVLITIGANDIMQVAKENMTNLVIDEFVKEQIVYEYRLEQILHKMQDINPEADIYLLGIYNPFEKYFEDIEELNQIVEAWNETSSDLAEDLDNVTFIPMIDLFAGNEDPIFADDNFHPNYAGYYLMAERVLDYISREEG